MSIEVRNLRKTFGKFVALNNVSLDVPGGELVALLVPRDRARPPSSGSSRGWSRPIRGPFFFMARMRPTDRSGSGRWGSSSSTTPCSGT